MSVTEPRTLIVGSDLSPGTRDLLTYALETRHGTHARIVLVHVVEVGQHIWAALSREYAADDVKERLFAMADSVLRDLSAHEAKEPPVGVEVQIHWGDPANLLVNVARIEGADLIVLGRHTPGKLREFVLGGVTDKVLRRAPCPVVVVPQNG